MLRRLTSAPTVDEERCVWCLFAQSFGPCKDRYSFVCCQHLTLCVIPALVVVVGVADE